MGGVQEIKSKLFCPDLLLGVKGTHIVRTRGAGWERLGIKGRTLELELISN